MPELDPYAEDLIHAGAVAIRCRPQETPYGAPDYLTCYFEGNWSNLQSQLEYDYHKIVERREGRLHWFILRPVNRGEKTVTTTKR